MQTLKRLVLLIRSKLGLGQLGHLGMDPRVARRLADIRRGRWNGLSPYN